MDKFGRAKISCHVCSDRHEDIPCIQGVSVSIVYAVTWVFLALAAFVHSPPSHFPVILARWQSAAGPIWPPQASCPALSYSPGIHLKCFALSHAAAQSLLMGSCCILWGSQSVCWPSLGAGGFRMHLQGGRPGAVSFLCPGLQLAQHLWSASPTQPSAGVPLLLEEYAEGSHQSCAPGCVPVMGWVPCAVTKYPAALASSFPLLSSFIPLLPPCSSLLSCPFHSFFSLSPFDLLFLLQMEGKSRKQPG